MIWEARKTMSAGGGVAAELSAHLVYGACLRRNSLALCIASRRS